VTTGQASLIAGCWSCSLITVTQSNYKCVSIISALHTENILHLPAANSLFLFLWRDRMWNCEQHDIDMSVLSLCLSVTLGICVKTAKCIVEIFRRLSSVFSELKLNHIPKDTLNGEGGGWDVGGVGQRGLRFGQAMASAWSASPGELLCY